MNSLGTRTKPVSITPDWAISKPTPERPLSLEERAKDLINWFSDVNIDKINYDISISNSFYHAQDELYCNVLEFKKAGNDKDAEEVSQFRSDIQTKPASTVLNLTLLTSKSALATSLRQEMANWLEYAQINAISQHLQHKNLERSNLFKDKQAELFSIAREFELAENLPHAKELYQFLVDMKAHNKDEARCRLSMI